MKPSEDATPGEVAYCAFFGPVNSVRAKPWSEASDNMRALWEHVAEAVLADSWSGAIDHAATELYKQHGIPVAHVIVGSGDLWADVGSVEVDVGTPLITATPAEA